MPELPEVETIARGLRKAIVGKKIKSVNAVFPGIVKQNSNLFCKIITGRTVLGVRRRGKYLLIDLSNGVNRPVHTGGKTLLVHLGMTGNLLLDEKPPSSSKRSRQRAASHGVVDKHDHVIFTFCGERQVLRYNDQRKFGKLKVCDACDEQKTAELRELGPEALDISPAEFVCILRKRKGKIKSLLLNQKVIAGLGNIYADEALFGARIHPAQRADRLSDRKLGDLHRSIKATLRRAIKAGGSSIDNYLHVDGQIGGFQLQHKVYGREGERCRRCGAMIKRIKISQRSSYFCPRCQPLKKT
jgi:formamidopyrimidine-DNA glycosylase